MAYLFKFVESFELDVLALIQKHVQGHVQIALLSDVSSQDVKSKEDFVELE